MTRILRKLKTVNNMEAVMSIHALENEKTLSLKIERIIIEIQAAILPIGYIYDVRFVCTANSFFIVIHPFSTAICLGRLLKLKSPIRYD